MRTLISASIGLLVLAFCAPGASGREFYIIQIKDEWIVCDISKSDGISETAKVKILRNVSYIHPVAKKKITDKFVVGAGELSVVGDNLSLIVLSEEVKKKVSVGDLVEPEGMKKEEKPAEKKTVESKIIESEDELFGKVIEGLKGKGIDGKIQSLLAYLSKHPQSKYRDFIGEEVRKLKKAKEENAKITQVNEQLKQAAESDVQPKEMDKQTETIKKAEVKKEEKKDGKPIAVHIPPALFPEGKPFDAVVAAFPGDSIKEADIHYKKTPGGSFVHERMKPEGKNYFVARVPADQTTGERIEYYVTAKDNKDGTIYVAGSEGNPVKVGIQKQYEPGKKQRENRSALKFSSEYINFYSDNYSFDYYYTLEGSFRYKLLLPYFTALRFGFGYFDGATGDIKEMETVEGFKSDKLGFGYGLAEAEIEFLENITLLPRVIVGTLNKKTEIVEGKEKKTGETGEKLYGFYGTLRIGKEYSTNLQIGGGMLMSAGWEAFINFRISLVKDLLIGLGTSATNMPLDENVGFRIFGDIGYNHEWFGISVRPSLNFRHIKHGGPGVGMALHFNW